VEVVNADIYAYRVWYEESYIRFVYHRVHVACASGEKVAFGENGHEVFHSSGCDFIDGLEGNCEGFVYYMDEAADANFLFCLSLAFSTR
jgi:hypothetical protein